MSTKASKEVLKRLEIVTELLMKSEGLAGKEENELIREKGKELGIIFPDCIDAYKRVANLRLKTEELCSSSCLERLKKSDLKLANVGADILLLKKVPFCDVMEKWSCEWADLSREQMERKIRNYIDANCELSHFEKTRKFERHDKLKRQMARIFLCQERSNIYTRQEVLIKKGYRPDMIGLDLAGNLTILEVKTKASDFKIKKEKIKQYTTYCNYFYLLTDDEEVKNLAENYFVSEGIKHAKVVFYDGEFSYSRLSLTRVDIKNQDLLKKIPELLVQDTFVELRMIDWNKEIDINEWYAIDELIAMMKRIINEKIDNLIIRKHSARVE